MGLGHFINSESITRDSRAIAGKNDGIDLPIDVEFIA